ncbi:protein NETWORKED 4A-like [Cornus florida]|uniref:protein NETWORKED 4A-like n=1 Tax=Cornus florida TaxID=4283 RepID=UPI0028A09D0D|nr:protein NETWORKED 4A-like [Cornus florida]
MKTVELKTSHSRWWDSYISSNSSKWLAENRGEVDQSVQHMRKLIEEDGDSFAKKAEMYYEKRPELVALVEEFYRMYQALAERYDLLTGELRKNITSVIQMQSSGISDPFSDQASPFLTPENKLVVHKSGDPFSEQGSPFLTADHRFVGHKSGHPFSDQASPFYTPDHKLVGHKSGQQAVGFDLSVNSGGSSSDLSLKGSPQSSSSPSSDSDSESFNSSINYSGPPVNSDDRGLHEISVEQEMELPGMEKVQVTKEEKKYGMSKVRESGGYEMLLRQITEYEEELRISNKKLQFSEEEIVRLKDELKKNESVTVLMDNLRAQLDSTQNDITMREADIEMEKGRVLDLQKQVADLEKKVSDSSCKVGTLVEELKLTREKLKDSEEELSKLKHGLSNEIFEATHKLQGQLELAQKDVTLLEAKLDAEKRQVLELEERILSYIADVSDRDQEIKDLIAALGDTRINFSLEKANFQSDISSLSEQIALLWARIEEQELQKQSLESELRQHETDKMEMKCQYEAQERDLQGDIERLKNELYGRGAFVETLNKNLDELKLKYDMLMAEKDGINANLQTLIAEMNSRDKQMEQLEGNLHQMQVKYVDLVAGSESSRKLADELNLKVVELEKEVDRQSVVISDRAEEKKEAIRQLCFALEHYRSGYKELRQAFIGHKQRAVLAS